jgi:hypothetical protein
VGCRVACTFALLHRLVCQQTRAATVGTRAAVIQHNTGIICLEPGSGKTAVWAHVLPKYVHGRVLVEIRVNMWLSEQLPRTCNLNPQVVVQA